MRDGSNKKPPHTHTSRPSSYVSSCVSSNKQSYWLLYNENCQLFPFSLRQSQPTRSSLTFGIFPPRSLLRSKMRNNLITFISVQRCDGERDLSWGEMPFCTTRWCSWLFLLLQKGLWGAVIHVIQFIPVTSPGWTPALITGYSVLARGPSKSPLWWHRIYSDSVFRPEAQISIEGLI